MKKMKESHERIMKAINQYRDEHGVSPTIREICKITGYKSTSTVRFHLYQMTDLGILEERSYSSPRCIKPVKEIFTVNRMNVLLLNAIECIRTEKHYRYDKEFDDFLIKELCFTQDEIDSLQIRGEEKSNG